MGSKLLKDLSYGEPLDLSFVDHRDFPQTSKACDFLFDEVSPTQDQISILYELLKSRKFRISHKHVPTFEEHVNFVNNHPYRKWWLIHDSINKLNIIGSVYVSFDNSVGVDLNFEKISFSAAFFNQKLREVISPLISEPSKTFCDFFYNVAPDNHDLIDWLSEAGYATSQVSLSLK